MHRFVLALLFLGFTTTLAAQDKKPEPKPERFTYRIQGLFSPDREKDLKLAFADLPDITFVSVNFDDAEITVEFVPAKVFPGAKPEQVLQRLDDKVRNATRSTFSVKPRRTIPREKLEQIVIPAAGCDCKACCFAAYEAIANIDGVFQATASFKEGKITALIDPTKTDRAKLETALRKREVSIPKK